MTLIEMNKWLKRLLILLPVMAVAYYFLIIDSPSPSSDAAYDLDMDAVRRLANSVPGASVREIRAEKVAEFEFAEAMVMAGEPWKGTPIPIYSFQLVFPGSSIIVDTAVSTMEGMPGFMVTDFDKAAAERMFRAMEMAEQIVITHEHFDHIDGIAAHPNLKSILPAVRLTKEQIDHPERMTPTVLPADIFDDYKPLEYDAMLAIAPGVVLIKAPGHTPGSQMVYVQTRDGNEVLFLGDVAWQYRNIEAVKERPLFMTLLVRENREQVINQFQALHELAKQEPNLYIVPGHDEIVMRNLLSEGIIRERF